MIKFSIVKELLLFSLIFISIFFLTSLKAYNLYTEGAHKNRTIVEEGYLTDKYTKTYKNYSTYIFVINNKDIKPTNKQDYSIYYVGDYMYFTYKYTNQAFIVYCFMSLFFLIIGLTFPVRVKIN